MPEPTPDPTPESMPEPTPEPTAEPTPEPTPKLTPEPSISLDSLDSYIVEAGVTLVAIISASSDGRSLNCSVEGIDGDHFQCTFLSGAAELPLKPSPGSVAVELAFKIP